VSAEQYGRIIELHIEGRHPTDIAVRVGTTHFQVRRALKLYRAQLAALPGGRPEWSYPDKEMLRFAAKVRREIAEAEGYERPLI